MKFFLHLIPPTVTHQGKKVNTRGKKPRFYEPIELKDARMKLTSHLSKHRPESPLIGPLSCTVKWLFPITGKRCLNTYHGQPKATKPDGHNMQKLLFDVMTDLEFWKDDAQVADERIVKVWSKIPGIFIQIEKMYVWI